MTATVWRCRKCGLGYLAELDLKFHICATATLFRPFERRHGGRHGLGGLGKQILGMLDLAYQRGKAAAREEVGGD